MRKETPQQDMSRVLSAIAHKKASGYRDLQAEDSIFTILGGQELDGTPTIHTRGIVTVRPRRPKSAPISVMDPKVWAARIGSYQEMCKKPGVLLSNIKDRLGQPSLAHVFSNAQKNHVRDF